MEVSGQLHVAVTLLVLKELLDGRLHELHSRMDKLAEKTRVIISACVYTYCEQHYAHKLQAGWVYTEEREKNLRWPVQISPPSNTKV
jgi:hypothetical protein